MSYKGLDKLYTVYLSFLLEKKIQKGILPSKDQMDSVSSIKEEIQRLPFEYFSETIKYIARVDENYKILKQEKYKQELETKYKEAKTRLLKSNKKSEKKLLKEKMRKLEEKLFLYGH